MACQVDPEYFWWAREALTLHHKQYEEAGDLRSIFEVRAGLNFIESEYSDMIDSLAALPPGTITFRYLWAVLPPNCKVIGADSLDEPRVYCVRSHRPAQQMDGSIVLRLSTEHVDTNGEMFGLVNESLNIPEFSGSMAFIELPYAPLSLHPRRESLRQRALDRNRKQLTFHTKEPLLREYIGHALTVKQDRMAKFNVRLHCQRLGIGLLIQIRFIKGSSSTPLASANLSLTKPSYQS